MDRMRADKVYECQVLGNFSLATGPHQMKRWVHDYLVDIISAVRKRLRFHKYIRVLSLCADMNYNARSTS
jgi:hypothetical protein